MNTNVRLTTMIGGAFLILSSMRLTSGIQLDHKYVFSLSIAGFLFIIFDFLSFEAKDSYKTIKKQKMFDRLAYFSLYAAVLSIIVLPHFSFLDGINKMQEINDFIVLFGLGLVIIMISNKDLREQLEFYKSQLKTLEELHGSDLLRKNEEQERLDKDNDSSIENPKEQRE
ncbi:hypothetical protein [Cohnella phaseoli]|uniref:Uncharacterized protein n=1 Tax=Cohnella phaseoli TaxID=456490 RepID=A0A3D9JQ76_9BACL|nr:hypothetical protein [Cohnella phaseoli]RED76145.1 hypothetical protein DFP98_113206 [Cohnella phaseoli]